MITTDCKDTDKNMSFKFPESHFNYTLFRNVSFLWLMTSVVNLEAVSWCVLRAGVRVRVVR